MTIKNKSTDRSGSQSSAQPQTSTFDGKTHRAIERARCFFAVIGRNPDKPKRVRGRLGGETPKDERHWERRKGVQARVAARELAAHQFAMSQIAMVFDSSEAFA
jgi:hypothetical protein